MLCGPGEPAVDTLVRRSPVDAVFIALHGRGGEDGCVQGALELMGVPYTGSGVLASALAMDKLKAKEMFRLHNVPTPPYYVASREDLADVTQLHGSFGFPAIVKPRREGSSIGLAKVTGPGELERAISSALTYDEHVVVERYVSAAEVHVGILEGQALGAVEVVPREGLYDYRAKYTAGMTEYFSPPRLPATRLRGVVNLAERAAKALSCSGACRVDVLVTEGENEYVLEVNTLPGMTPTSLLPKIAAAAGLDYPSLCDAILLGARLHAGLFSRPSQDDARPVSTRRARQQSHIVCTGEDASSSEAPTNAEYAAGGARRRVRRAAG
jgi:D-alanine-D-alanine ligase